MNIKLIEESLHEAINTFASRLPAEHTQGMHDLVDAGESGVAFENFCVDLFEYDVFPDEIMVARLEGIAKAMNIDHSYSRLLMRSNV